MRFISNYINGSYAVKLDLENLKIPERAIIEPYLLWTAKTYKKLNKDGGDPDVWDALFGASNWVLKQLNDEQLAIFAKTFAMMQKMILDRMPQDGNRLKEIELINELGHLYLGLIDQLDLITLFNRYSEQFIRMGDMSEIGTRPQDTEALTFYEGEMRQLIVIALLCKLLTPIFGSLITKMPNIVDENGKEKQPTDRELRCVGITKPFVTRYYQTLHDKFRGYLTHTVNGCIPKDNTAAAVFSGYTPATRVNSIYANLLVRNFVNVDLRYHDSNIMRFCDSIARTLVSTQDSASNQHQVKTRVPYGAGGGSDDPGNIAQLETDSVVSNRTYDTPIIIESEVPRCITKYCLMYDISSDEFTACRSHFQENVLFPTPLNQHLACSYFGKDFGGGRGLLHLGSSDFTSIVALLQMIVFSNALIALGHMLTASVSNQARIKLEQEDLLLKLNYGNSYAFRNIKERFEASPVSNGGREWDMQVEEIVSNMLSTIYLYNTPDFIWNKLNHENINGRPIRNDVEVIAGACAFTERIEHAPTLA